MFDLETTSSSNQEGPAALKIYRRNIRLWFDALVKRFYLVVLAALLAGGGVMIFMSIGYEKTYTATALLLRKEVHSPWVEFGHDESRLPVSVLKNLICTQENMMHVLLNLELKGSPSWLFNTIDISTTEKSSINNLYRLSSTTDSPELSAQIANELARVFIESYKNELLDPLQKNARDLRSTRDKLVSESKEIDAQRRRYYDNATPLEEQMRLCASRSADCRRKANELELMMAGDSQLLAVTREKLANTKEQIVSYYEENTDAQRRLESLRGDLTALREIYSEEHPLVANKKRELEALTPSVMSDTIRKGSDKTIWGINPEYNELRRTVIELETKLLQSAHERHMQIIFADEADSTLRRMTAIEPLYTALVRRYDLCINRLAEINSKVASIEAQIKSELTDISIKEAATVPLSHNPTKRLLFAFAAAFFAGMSTLGVVMLLEALCLKFRSAEDFEEALDIECYAQIPQFSDRMRTSYMQMMQNAFSHMLDCGRRTPCKLELTAVVDFDSEPWWPRVADSCSDFCALRDVRMTRVVLINAFDESKAPHILNDLFFGVTDELPKPDANNAFYLLIDDMVHLATCQNEPFDRLKKALQVNDMLIFEIACSQTESIIAQYIIQNCTQVVYLARYNRTTKPSVAEYINYTSGRDIVSGGIVYDMKPKFWRKVSS